MEELGHRIVLHFLPPYCPDANRIERVWQDLHANVTRNHRCKTMKALIGNARAYLEAYVWRRELEKSRETIAQMREDQRAQSVKASSTGQVGVWTQKNVSFCRSRLARSG